MSDSVSECKCKVLHELYEDMYAHIPINSFPIIFLWGWLVHHKGCKVNWPQYAYETTQEWMKRTWRPLMSSKGFSSSLASFGQLLNVKNPYFSTMMGMIILFWKVLKIPYVLTIPNYNGGEVTKSCKAPRSYSLSHDFCHAIWKKRLVERSTLIACKFAKQEEIFKRCVIWPCKVGN